MTISMAMKSPTRRRKSTSNARPTSPLSKPVKFSESGRCYIIMAPTIFGLGTGPFIKLSAQLPAIIADALKAQHVKVIGDGQTIWTFVHIEDLTGVFALLRQVIYGSSIPSGRRGIYFRETGEYTHLEMAQRLANAGAKLGLFSNVLKVSLQEAPDSFAGGNVFRAELSFGAK